MSVDQFYEDSDNQDVLPAHSSTNSPQSKDDLHRVRSNPIVDVQDSAIAGGSATVGEQKTFAAGGSKSDTFDFDEEEKDDDDDDSFSSLTRFDSTGDMYGAGATVENFQRDTYEAQQISIKQYFGSSSKRKETDEQIGREEVNISKYEVSLETWRSERKSYLERPGYQDALQLIEKQRVLLLTGPEGCGLDVSVKALTCDLYTNVFQRPGQIYHFPHSMPISAEHLLWGDTELQNAIFFFQDGLRTEHSLIVQLFRDGSEADLSRIIGKLKQIDSWIIITCAKEPRSSHAQSVYRLFHPQRTVELRLPDLQELFTESIKQECGAQAQEVSAFLAEHFPNAAQQLRTSQDVKLFAGRCWDVFSTQYELEVRKQKISKIISRISSIQREVRYLLEEQLERDNKNNEILLAILLSVLNESDSNFFWPLFDYVKSKILPEIKAEENKQDEEEKQEKEENNQNDQRSVQKERSLPRSIFAQSRAKMLAAIRAEEVKKNKIIEGEDIAYKVVRYIDDRYPNEILTYAQAHSTALADICWILQDRLIEEQSNDPAVHRPIATAIADLALADWDNILVPLLEEWAKHPKPHMRARVGDALDKVLQEGTYVGNVRHLLNNWIAAPIGDESSLNLKWTVASACKQIGLTDIGFGLAYIKKLAGHLGQFELREGQSLNDLLRAILDSEIESIVVYDAIRYAMVVFCVQGYMEPVMRKLQHWMSEPQENSALGAVATSLIFGVFQEFGSLALESQQAAKEADWDRAVLRELGVRVYRGSRPAYIYNQALQYFLEHHKDQELFEGLSVVFARAFENARAVNQHGLIYAIFFQWADELGAVRHSKLRAGSRQLQKLFLKMCEQLRHEDFNEVRKQMKGSHSDKELPKHVRDFARKISYELKSVSMRYARRRRRQNAKKRR